MDRQLVPQERGPGNKEQGPGAGKGLVPRSLFLVPWALLAGYALALSFLSIRRFESLEVFSDDLATYDQIIWNAAHGRLFASSLLSWFATSSLGDHVNPFLLLLVPLYWVWPNPRLLLIVQALALALAVVPVVWWARERLRSHLAVAVVAITFVFYAPLAHVGLFEFHEVSLAVPLLSFATYYLLCRRPLPFALLTLLALTVKEEVAFVVLGLGLYAVGLGWRRLGLALAAVAVGWAYLGLEVIMPGFTAEGISWFAHRYAYLGDSPAQMFGTLLSRPFYVLGHLLTMSRLEFLGQLLLPLGFLPLLGWPVALLALPTLGYHLLSDNPPQYSIRFHYTALLLPFLFFALVQGLERIRGFGFRISQFELRNRRLATAIRWLVPQRALPIYMLAASALGFILFSPLPFGGHFRAERYRLGERSQLGRQLVASIPPTASVSADRTLVGHLSQRERVYIYPFRTDAEYVLLDLSRSYRPGRLRPAGETLAGLLADPTAPVGYQGEGLAIVRRGAAVERRVDGQLGVRLGETVALRGYALWPGRTLRPGTDLTVALEWEILRQREHRYTTFVHLVDQTGRRWAQHDSEPWEGYLPFSEWPEGRALEDPHRLRLPAEAPAGEYRLLAGLYDPLSQERLPVTSPARVPRPDAVELGPLRLAGEGENTEIQPTWVPAEVTFGQHLRLRQYQLSQSTLYPGDFLEVRLRWERLAALADDYTLFLHLAGADGVPLVQQDGQPGYGYRPTSRWQSETEETVNLLRIPATTPPATYTLQVGWYLLATMEHLPAAVDGRANPALRLAEIKVEPR